jgi:hypothetical protein
VVEKGGHGHDAQANEYRGKHHRHGRKTARRQTPGSGASM